MWPNRKVVALLHELFDPPPHPDPTHPSNLSFCLSVCLSIYLLPFLIWHTGVCKIKSTSGKSHNAHYETMNPSCYPLWWFIQYTFIGWVWGGPAAHVYHVHARDTPGFKPETIKLTNWDTKIDTQLGSDGWFLQISRRFRAGYQADL